MKTFAGKRRQAELAAVEGEAAVGASLPGTRAKWPMLQHVPVPMTVKIPLPGISLRGLAELTVGKVIVSGWPASEEVPLFASNVSLSWGEFEVVDGSIAIRLTRLG